MTGVVPGEDAALLLRGLDTECDGEVGFAGADRAGQDQIFGRGHPRATGERMDLRGADALGGREIEAVEGLDLGKARLAEPLANHGLVSRRLLGAEDFVQVVLVRPVRVARLPRQAFKHTGDARQLQRTGLGDDEITGEGGGRHAGASVSHVS